MEISIPTWVLYTIGCTVVGAVLLVVGMFAYLGYKVSSAMKGFRLW